MPGSLVIMAGQSNAIALNGGNGGMALDAAFAGLTGTQGVTVRQVAANGAPLTYGRSQADWYHGNEMAAGLIGTIRAALDADPGLFLSGVVWVQGEADSHLVARAGEYGARLESMVDALEAALAGYGARSADFRLSVLALSAECPEGATRAQWDLVRSQQLAIDHPRITVVDPDALLSTTPERASSIFQADGLHYQAFANATLLPSLLGVLNLHVNGTTGSDTLRGGAGHDEMDAGAGSDRMAGGSGNDVLWGRQGHDVLQGGMGTDVLIGGGGADTLEGGRGADRFVFFAEARNPGGAIDQITDFQRRFDVIDLRFIDADALRAGDQAFRLADRPDGAGSLWLDGEAGGTRVFWDTNGDGQADGSFLCARVATLSEADFLF